MKCDRVWGNARLATMRPGERGVVDLMAINGYYTFLAMVMNAAQAALPEGAAPGLPRL